MLTTKQSKWQPKILGKLTVVTDGSHFSPKKTSDGFPLATVENLRENLIDIESCYKISKTDYLQLVKNNNQPEIGDILFSKDGTVGKTLVYTQNEKITVLSSIAIIRKSDKIDSFYLKFVLQSNFMKSHLSKYYGGTAIKRIVLRDLSKFEFPYPTLLEQKKIARNLSDTDELIKQLDYLIEKKKNIKQGVMQELLTGKRRLEGFSGEWNYKTFGELFDFLKTGSNSRDDLSENGDFGYIHYGDIHAKWYRFLDCDNEDIPKISKEKVKNLPFLQDGDLILVDASEDYVGIGAGILLKNVKNKKIVSGLHTMLLRSDKTKLSSVYSAYLTSIRDVKDKLIKITTGISVYGLSKNQLKKVEVYLPNDINEQSEIAKIISDMDLEIRELETQKDKYIKLKQGMMQKLLTGEIRLK